MVDEPANIINRPSHYNLSVEGEAQPVQAGEVFDDPAQLERLKAAGWEIEGNTAKNPATGTTVTIGDVLTPTQAKEINASIDAEPAPAAGGAPAGGGGAPAGGGAPPAGGGGAPAAEAPPPAAGPGEKYSKGDLIDAGFLERAQAAGWNVVGDTAISPDGTKFKVGEHMSFDQARDANEAGIPKKAPQAEAAPVPA